MRWPVQLPTTAIGEPLLDIDRRGKYLLFNFASGAIIIHLGMSGSLRVLSANTIVGPHDHADFEFENDRILRLNDPRRFGSIHWQAHGELHPLLASLGPEPLSDHFNPTYLFTRARQRKTAIKTFIMNSQVVVGVGNIYANEALFRAGIRPRRRTSSLTKREITELVAAIQATLEDALEMGGTTLRNYVGAQGKPGYFIQKLNVYGREGEPCFLCESTIKSVKLGQRQTVYCPQCQR